MPDLRARLPALLATWQDRARQLHARAMDTLPSEARVYDLAAEQTWDAAANDLAALLRKPPAVAPISSASDWLPKRYLGDGVYAAIEHGMVKLTTDDGVAVSNVIFLEPDVLEALKRFYTDAITAARARGEHQP